jgi:transposase
MSNLYWLTEAQMDRLRPVFPKSHRRPRVDDRRVLAGIIFINCNRLRWCDALAEYAPPKTLDPGRRNCCLRVTVARSAIVWVYFQSIASLPEGVADGRFRQLLQLQCRNLTGCIPPYGTGHSGSH